MHYLYNDENESTDSDESLNDYLLSKKPKLYLTDILGRTPIFYLFVKMNDEFNSNLLDPISSLSKLLEYKDIDINLCDIFGNSILHYASQRGSIISILSLIAKNIKIDQFNNENNTPLVYSLFFKQINVAINLISQNCNLENNAFPLKERNEIKIFKENIKKNNSLIDLNTQVPYLINKKEINIEISNEEKDKIKEKEKKK